MQVLSTADGEGHSSAAGVSDVGVMFDDMVFGAGHTAAISTSSSSSSYPQLSNIMASRNPVSDGTQIFTPDRKIMSVKNLRGARPSPEPGSADRPPRKSPRPADQVEDLRRKLEEVTSQASRDKAEITSEARDAAERVFTRQHADFENAAQNFQNTAARATQHEVAQQQAYFNRRHQQVLGDLRSQLQQRQIVTAHEANEAVNFVLREADQALQNERGKLYEQEQRIFQQQAIHEAQEVAAQRAIQDHCKRELQQMQSHNQQANVYNQQLQQQNQNLQEENQRAQSLLAEYPVSLEQQVSQQFYYLQQEYQAVKHELDESHSYHMQSNQQAEITINGLQMQMNDVQLQSRHHFLELSEAHLENAKLRTPEDPPHDPSVLLLQDEVNKLKAKLEASATTLSTTEAALSYVDNQRKEASNELAEITEEFDRYRSHYVDPAEWEEEYEEQPEEAEDYDEDGNPAGDGAGQPAASSTEVQAFTISSPRRALAEKTAELEKIRQQYVIDAPPAAKSSAATKAPKVPPLTLTNLASKDAAASIETHKAWNGVKEKEEIHFKPFPKTLAKFRDWKADFINDITISSSHPIEALKWINEVWDAEDMEDLLDSGHFLSLSTSKSP